MIFANAPRPRQGVAGEEKSIYASEQQLKEGAELPPFILLLTFALLIIVSWPTLYAPAPDTMWLGRSLAEHMPVIISLIVLGAGLYVILSNSYAPEDKKWGYGSVGTVVGYWLRQVPPSRRPRRTRPDAG